MGLSLMDTSSKLSNNTAVILVSHGSTLPYAEVTFTEIKEKVGQRLLKIIQDTFSEKNLSSIQNIAPFNYLRNNSIPQWWLGRTF